MLFFPGLFTFKKKLLTGDSEVPAHSQTYQLWFAVFKLWSQTRTIVRAQSWHQCTGGLVSENYWRTSPLVILFHLNSEVPWKMASHGRHCWELRKSERHKKGMDFHSSKNNLWEGLLYFIPDWGNQVKTTLWACHSDITH